MRSGKLFVVCGLGFGDEGKGSVVDVLVRRHGAGLVVRYNGGPQAGHNVVSPDGVWHCFAQFGAGTLVPGVRTLLSREMLVEPENLLAEAAALSSKGHGDALARLKIDPRCAVVTPLHKMIGQMLEICRGGSAYGSCGMGVGQAVLDRDAGDQLTVGELVAGRGLERRLKRLRKKRLAEAGELLKRCSVPELREAYEYFRQRTEPDRLLSAYRGFAEAAGGCLEGAEDCLEEAIWNGTTVVFEGAQGALLDRRFGFAPYVTKTRSTWHNVAGLLDDCLAGGAMAERIGIAKIGALRAYGHRHGAGPFVTEDAALADRLADPCNAANRWQGKFRLGWFDLVALRYGIKLNGGVSRLALTGLDRLSGLDPIRVCSAYDYDGDTAPLDRYFDWESRGPGRARIFAIRKPRSAAPEGELARLLRSCRPAAWVDLPGWPGEIGAVRRIEDLPPRALGYAVFLQEQLGVPLDLISVGPSADAKMFI